MKTKKRKHYKFKFNAWDLSLDLYFHGKFQKNLIAFDDFVPSSGKPLGVFHVKEPCIPVSK